MNKITLSAVAGVAVIVLAFIAGIDIGKKIGNIEAELSCIAQMLESVK